MTNEQRSKDSPNVPSPQYAGEATLRHQILAFENIFDAVILTDAESRIIDWNPAASRMFGYSREEVLGKSPEIFHRPADRPYVQQAIIETIREKMRWEGEVHFIRKDGSEGVLEVIVVPLLDELGAVIGSVGVNRDITERKRAEEEHERLLQQIQQQERLVAVGQLAAGIAHDFNNIMATIVLYTQIMARTPGRPDRDYERLSRIEQQAQHATHLIQQILDFSRRTVLQLEPLDLWPFLQEQVEILRRTLPETIDITIERPSGSPEAESYLVQADPTRIQQVIMNLGLNARDAMPNGGKLKLTLTRLHGKAPFAQNLPPEAERVSSFVEKTSEPAPDSSQGNAWIQVSVQDTGTGMAKETLPHIFEPFFTTKEPGSGTGLGLPQVLGIIKQHGGEIEARSQIGQGSTFTFILPALAHAAPPPLDEQKSGVLYGEGEAILLVEDNEAARGAIQEALQLLNYTVLTAANGREALDILQQPDNAIALILSDVVMPEMGGIALIKALQRQDIETPVVLMTGHPINGELETLRTHRPIRQLMKPLDMDELAEVLSQALNDSPMEERKP